MLMNDLAEQLDAMAEELRRAQVAYTYPRQEYTLEEARQKLRAATGPDSYNSIKPASVDDHPGSPPATGDWHVYTTALKRPGQSGTHFEGKTLAAAVNACLAALTPPPAEPVAALGVILDPEMAGAGPEEF